MIWLFVVMVILFVGGIILHIVAEDRGLDGTVVVALIIILVSVTCMVIYGFLVYGAVVKTKLINSEFGTKYTTEQVLFGSDIIEELRQRQRQRIELQMEDK